MQNLGFHPVPLRRGSIMYRNFAPCLTIRHSINLMPKIFQEHDQIAARHWTYQRKVVVS